MEGDDIKITLHAKRVENSVALSKAMQKIRQQNLQLQIARQTIKTLKEDLAMFKAGSKASAMLIENLKLDMEALADIAKEWIKK